MEPNQAWQSVLSQLETTLPRASFDTWVRGTHFVSLRDTTFVIATSNSYARDWLTDRLSIIVEKLLSDLMGVSTHVEFVVDTYELEQGEDLLPPPAPRTDPPFDPEGTEEIVLADYDSLYEQVVRPNRAVYLTGYFRRWLKVLGPDLAWMYVGFRQAGFIAGARSGRSINRIPGAAIAGFSGITERTYWNRAENKNTWEKLKGLVHISDHGPEWDPASSTPKRLPRRYTIAMTLPLTSVDANSLRLWLSKNIEKYGGPEGVLKAVLQTPLNELIPASASDLSEPVTVRKLVHELFAGGNLSNELLDSLSSAIQNHLMPQGDLIVITEYFLKTVLPHLGAGPAWMLTLLRDMCFVDTKTGETRNRVMVKGGYAEIAGWLGMARAKTIWDWSHEKLSASSKVDAGKY